MSNWVALLLGLDFFLGSIQVTITFGMATPTIGFRFNQTRASTHACPLNSSGSGGIDF